MQLGEIVRATAFSERRLRYLLESGAIPLDEKDTSPGHGKYRQFSLGQCFIIAVGYQLLEAGVPLRIIRNTCHVLSTDFEGVKSYERDEFNPVEGRFGSQFDWCLILMKGRLATIIPREEWQKGMAAPFIDIKDGKRVEFALPQESYLAQVSIPLCRLADYLVSRLGGREVVNNW